MLSDLLSELPESQEYPSELNDAASYSLHDIDESKALPDLVTNIQKV